MVQFFGVSTHFAFQELYPREWDRFDWDDARCQEMVAETIMWIHRFIGAWFVHNYGPLLYQDWDAWRNHLER